MSATEPVYVMVEQAAIAHLLKLAQMVDDFHELQAAAAAVDRSLRYTRECAVMESLRVRGCDEK